MAYLALLWLFVATSWAKPVLHDDLGHSPLEGGTSGVINADPLATPDGKRGVVLPQIDVPGVAHVKRDLDDLIQLDTSIKEGVTLPTKHLPAIAHVGLHLDHLEKDENAKRGQTSTVDKKILSFLAAALPTKNVLGSDSESDDVDPEEPVPEVKLGATKDAAPDVPDKTDDPEPVDDLEKTAASTKGKPVSLEDNKEETSITNDKDSTVSHVTDVSNDGAGAGSDDVSSTLDVEEPDTQQIDDAKAEVPELEAEPQKNTPPGTDIPAIAHITIELLLDQTEEAIPAEVEEVDEAVEAAHGMVPEVGNDAVSEKLAQQKAQDVANLQKIYSLVQARRYKKQKLANLVKIYKLKKLYQSRLDNQRKNTLSKLAKFGIFF